MMNQLLDDLKARSVEMQKPIAPLDRSAPRNAPAVVDSGSYADAYLDAVGGPEGRYCKFGKDGTFVTTDDGAEMNTDADYRVLWKETRVSWKKFKEGEPPEVHGGPLFDGYVLPRREELGDLNEAEWPVGLSGQPQDPWQNFLELVLQRTDTHEAFIFGTSSVTGRRAVAALLKHCQRASRTDANYTPLVKLRTGSFKHRDPRIGTVNVPSFAVCGSERTGAGTSAADELAGDSIPF